MQYGRISERALVVAMVLGSLLPAAPASADIAPCIGGPATCPPPTSCNDDAECFGQGLGRCVRTSGGGSGTCSPDCSAAFACNSDSDCPTFDPLIANCRATIAPGVPGVCQYHDPVGRQFATLCGDAGTSITAATIAACFSGTSWALGDCDMDGVANGIDGTPCDGTMTARVPAAPSPFCLPGRICEGTSSVCAPFLRCSTADTCVSSAERVGATSAWECSPVPGTSVSFCHPSCDATVHCSVTTDCASLGTCRTVSGSLSMCLPMPLSSCAASCSANPLDWSTGQGDCDGDGAQNGCDPNPCRTGDTPCFFNHLCSIDAGVPMLDASTTSDGGTVGLDAGNTTSDGGTPEDAATTSPDAAGTDAGSEPFDGGNVAMDATSPTPTTPGLGFGGGGGCRCGLAGGRAHGDAGGYVGLAIAMLVAARRRRVTRR